MANRAIYVIIAFVVIVIIVAGVLVYVFMNPGGGGGGGGTLTGTNIDIYCGDYWFGASASGSGSPGPQMVLTHGQSVTVTLHNVGTMAHNWAITNDKTDGSTNLPFSGAQIGSASNPVAAGGTQSVTFTVGNTGNYYYICQVDGHVSLGMWGTVTVN
jgi:FtsP/CotA-like multicopper oxidase with cupredoxin domain